MDLKMIPKSEMKPGAWYVGECRNTRVALWDAELKKFVHLRYKFGWMMDTIEHFEDVKESRADGFIPVKEIELPDYEQLSKLLKEIGY